MKLFLRRGVIIFLVFGTLEVILRLIGFGRLPVYYESDAYEYALMPSQDINRFGHHFYINEEGMRSEELRDNSFRIIKFGDSVLNGGVHTDQSSLASSILEDSLKNSLPEIQVLNVSAGSWEPDNAFAWMQENGDFEAKILVLVFSSHDWKEQMKFKRYVDQVPFYPSEQPICAITDALSWTYSRTLLTVDWNSLPQMERSEVHNSNYNLGWYSFIEYHQSSQKPLLVYHHATISELKSGEWHNNGKELQHFLSHYSIPVISGLESGMAETDYRDMIHPNESGQFKIAQALFSELKDLIQSDEAY